MAANSRGTAETELLNHLVEAIENLAKGLDPNVLSFWYRSIEKQARELCPDKELRTGIQVIQDPLFPMKFQIKSSRRAIPYIVRAVDSNLNEMPFATRMYFEKFVEILQLELANYMEKQRDG